MDEQFLIDTALATGFTNVAVMDVKDLVYVPEYRKFCEENLCGNYNLLPVCPPVCGTAEEMHNRIVGYQRALILQTELKPVKKEHSEYLAGKKAHNLLLEQLIAKLELKNILVMSCGPWKSYSCMSAYCIFVRKLAESCGLEYDCGPGLLAFFGMIVPKS